MDIEQEEPINARILIDGEDIGLLIDINSRCIYTPGQNPLIDSTINLICEKLQLERKKPKDLLKPYRKIK
jgi:hypothetical protein